MTEPIVDATNGVVHYYKDCKIHRDDGPAVIYPNGSQYWYQNGKLHREDGPAIIRYTGTVFWYLNDRLISFDVYCTQLNLGQEQKLVLMLKYGITNE